MADVNGSQYWRRSIHPAQYSACRSRLGVLVGDNAGNRGEKIGAEHYAHRVFKDDLQRHKLQTPD